MSRAGLVMVLTETVQRNRIHTVSVYLQVSRGVARREFPFPAGVRPTVVAVARPLDMAKSDSTAATGVDVPTRPAHPWGRCATKTDGLMPAHPAKHATPEARRLDTWDVTP